jgi:hypothetical protein
MTDDWKQLLNPLGRVLPDRETLRSAVVARSTSSVPPRESSRRGRVLTVAISLAIGVSSFALVLRTFTPDGFRAVQEGRRAETGGTATNSGIDPREVCAVPRYDPTVALLVGSRSEEYPLSILQEPGDTPAEISGAASSALRQYLEATPGAPEDGWRRINSAGSAMAFAAPMEDDSWWLTIFEMGGGTGWRLATEEVVEQEWTPAQKGRGLRLSWDEDVTLANGSWSSPLRLSNESGTQWVTDGREYRGTAHVFDAATGTLQAASIASSGTVGGTSLAPGASMLMPLALAQSVPLLAEGDYQIVACVPQLGLSSPIATLHVVNDASVPDVAIATYEGNLGMTGAMQGRLVAEDGCLGLASASSMEFLVLPTTLSLVLLEGTPAVVSPTGAVIGRLGENIRLSGGHSTRAGIEQILDGHVPEACRVTGERYFVVSDPSSIVFQP